MTAIYVPEYDLARPELEVDQAGTIAVWPKYRGRNVEVASATAEVRSETGETLQGPAAVSPSTVTYGDRDISRIDATVSAIGTPDQNYQLVVVWVMADGTRGTELLTFDVCLHPLGSAVTLQELTAMKPDVAEELWRQGAGLGWDTEQDRKEYGAATRAMEARAHLQARLAAVAQEAQRIRPHMILDRRALHAVERLFAMASVWEAAGGTLADLDDRPRSLDLKHWTNRAEAEWSRLRVEYMAEDAEDTSPAGETNFARAFVMRRH